MKILKQQAGDTIIEVLVVLAVLGLAIGISYATATRSLMAARQAQETSGAVEQLRAEIEALHSMYKVDTSQFATIANEYHCVMGPPGSYTISAQVTGTGGKSPDISIASDRASYTSGGNNCTANSLYYIYFVYNGNANNGAFTVKAQWDDAAGQGIDSSTLIYNVDQDY